MSDASFAGFERSEPLPGVRLITERMPYVRSVSLGLYVDVGARDEPEPMAGASHLLEHLLFKGTTSRTAREIAEAFDAVGGDLNAYSAKEHTCYHCRVLDDDLAMATEILCDMFRDSVIAAEDLEAERKVVLEEIRMTDDTPDDLVHDVFAQAAFGEHSLGRPVLGTESSVGDMDRDLLHDFYRTGYVPGRLIVAAAGNVQHEALAELLRSGLAGGQARPGRQAQTDVHVGAGTRYLTRTTEQVHVVWGAEGVSRTDPDRYALSVLNTLFGGGMSSRLFQEIREKRGLVYSVFSYQHQYVETGLLAVYAGMQEATAAEVLRIVREEAAGVAAGGVSEEEVQRAKGQVKGSLVLSMDDPGGRMARLGKAELVHGEVLTVDETLARIDAVTAEDVTRLAARVFGGGGFVLSCVGPVAEGALDGFVEAL